MLARLCLERAVRLLVVLGVLLATDDSHAQVPSYLMHWGTYGTGPTNFIQPAGLVLDADGNVLVADGTLGRIKKFTPDGIPITEWGTACGSGPGELCIPYGVTVGPDGSVYVMEMFGRIRKFTSDGSPLLEWVASDAFQGLGIACNAAGDVFASILRKDFVGVIRKYTSTGVLISEWTSPASGPGFFDLASELAVDRHGNLYLAAWGQFHIIKFSGDGTLLAEWGTFGTGDGQFNEPFGVAVDLHDRVFVSDRQNHRVQVFDSNGAYLMQWDTDPPGEETGWPWGIDVDSQGNVFIADQGARRVVKFGYSPTATQRTSWSGLKKRFR